MWRKTRRQLLKDYVAFPLLAGPFAPVVAAGNLTANLARNIWAFMIISCGHFPEDVQEFSIEETENKTRGQWYFRQILGSANLTGGRLFHLLTGNLSFQIEHHLFPDIPAHRHAEISVEVRQFCERYGSRITPGRCTGSSARWSARSCGWRCRPCRSSPNSCRCAGGRTLPRRPHGHRIERVTDSRGTAYYRVP